VTSKLDRLTKGLIADFPELAEVAVAPLDVPGPRGPIDARVYRSRDPFAALVWVHGGAFAFGDLDMPEAHWVSLALAAQGVTVCSVDYRKAVHGVHHPVPRDDVLAAWTWAAATPPEPLSDLPLHLGGASAGACLATAVAALVRDTGAVAPRSLALVYPVLHAVLPPSSDELQDAIARAPQGATMFDESLMRSMSLNYVGDEDLFTDPHAFPGNGDLSGLPPTLIVNAEHDTLRASGELFAADLAAAGVEVVVETEPGTAHGHINDPSLPAAHRTVDRLARWLGRRA
jgi:acetyl esterase/lipase